MRSRSLPFDVCLPSLALFLHPMIENNYLGDWSSEKDCCCMTTDVSTTRAEAIFRVKWLWPTTVLLGTAVTQIIIYNEGRVQIILLFISSLEPRFLIIHENTVYMNWLPFFFCCCFFSVKSGKFKSSPSYHCWRYVIDLPAIVICYTETILSLQHFVTRASFSYISS